MSGPYAFYILASYGASGLGLLALTVWVVVTHRQLARKKARLEALGIRRGAGPGTKGSS